MYLSTSVNLLGYCPPLIICEVNFHRNYSCAWLLHERTLCVCVCVYHVVLLIWSLRGLLFGLSDGDAKEAVSSTCRSVTLHAGKY